MPLTVFQVGAYQGSASTAPAPMSRGPASVIDTTSDTTSGAEPTVTPISLASVRTAIGMATLGSCRAAAAAPASATP